MSDTSDLRLTAWAVTVAPGKVVLLGDIPGVDWDPLCVEFNTTWYQLAAAPLAGTGGQAQKVYELCARRLGVEPEQLSTNELWSRFNRVEDDLPTSWGEGGMPDPKAEDQVTVG